MELTKKKERGVGCIRWRRRFGDYRQQLRSYRLQIRRHHRQIRRVLVDLRIRHGLQQVGQ
jgi:hypothetical protein